MNKIIKHYFDKNYSSTLSLNKGDVVLKWDEDRAKLDKHKIFDSLWSRLYIIAWEIQKNT